MKKTLKELVMVVLTVLTCATVCASAFQLVSPELGVLATIALVTGAFAMAEPND